MEFRGENTNSIYSNTHQVFLDTPSTPITDTPSYVNPIPTFTLTEQLNTPVTPKGDRSSIEVSVTAPVFGAGEINNYSYSLVEYRVSGDDLWIAAKPASHESVIEVPTNGLTYQVRIRAVSTKKLANDTGPIQTITVTSIYGKTDAELASIYPFSALSLVVDNIDGAKFKYGTARLNWDHDNSELNYFNHYEITVSHATDGVLRTEIAAASNYEYSLAKNREDYSSNNSSEGIYDEVTFSVRAVSKIKNNLNDLYKGTAETKTVDSVPPPDVASLFIDGGVLYWAYQASPLDLSGFEVRVHDGGRSTWADAIPMHSGLISEPRFTLPSNTSGKKTFLVKAVDTSGNYSVNQAVLTITLGDAKIANIILTYDYQANSWPGTITNGTLNGSNEIEADQVGSFYNPDPGSIFYNQDNTSNFYDSEYKKLVYLFTYTVADQDAGSQFTIDEEVVADSYQLEFIPPDGGSSYIPFGGYIQRAEKGMYEFRLSVPSQFGSSVPTIEWIEVSLDVPDITEALNDISISSSGTRLPITKTYRGIRYVTLTMQTDGSGVTSLKVDDKDESLGPLVYAYNSSGTTVNTTIDAFIRGY